MAKAYDEFKKYSREKGFDYAELLRDRDFLLDLKNAMQLITLPSELWCLRHAESEYNKLEKELISQEYYKHFVNLFEKEWTAACPNFAYRASVKEFPSPELKQSALETIKKIYEKIEAKRDSKIALTERGHQQALMTGKAMAKKMKEPPDVILCSSYLRAEQTLERLIEGWPALKGVTTEIREELREQGWGINYLYYDWRLTFVLHPSEAAQRSHAGYYDHRNANGENAYELSARIDVVNNRIKECYPEKKILAISHENLIKRMISKYDGVPPHKHEEFREKTKLDNCSLTIYRLDREKEKNGRLVRKDEETNMKWYEET